MTGADEWLQEYYEEWLGDTHGELSMEAEVVATYKPVRCPYCKSQKLKGYGKNRHNRRERYHLCRGCGETFKSVEI